ncbi:MAG: BatD family protein [Mariprofundales bacterium]
MKRLFAVVGVVLLFPALAMASALASLDRTQIAAGTSVQLTISRDGGDGEPDVAPLQRDFEILGRSESSSYSFINGHGSSSKRWVLTLMPQHSGTLTIPAIVLGKQRTQPLTLTVTTAGAVPPANANPPGQGSSQSQAGQQGNVYVQAEAAPNDPKVQQQVIYTVRLYRAINLSQAQLSEPKVEHAVVVALGKDRNFEQVVGGHRYLVTERKYAIYPQQRGSLTIAPVRFDGRALSAGSMFDPFNQFGRAVRKFSNAVTLDVGGVAPIWPGGAWLPARQVTLSQTLSPGSYKAGEPITRTVELHADGLTSAQLSPILDGVLPDGLKRYPDQPLTNDGKSAAGVRGMRREKVAIIPLHGGNFMLPGVEVTWWNVATGTVETASIPAQLIKVVAAAGAPAVAVKSAPAAPAVAPSTITVDENGYQWLWQGVSLVLLLLWLVTLGLWWRARRTAMGCSSPLPEVLTERARADWVAQVRAACSAEDAAACDKVLRQWQRSLSSHQRRLIVVSGLHDAIAELQNYLYGSGKIWHTSSLLVAFDAANRLLDAHAQKDKNGLGNKVLPPLYPSA